MAHEANDQGSGRGTDGHAEEHDDEQHGVEPTAIEQGRLLHLAPQWQATPLPIYLAYRHASFYPAKLKKFIEAMKTAMPKVVHGLASRGESGVGS